MIFTFGHQTIEKLHPISARIKIGPHKSKGTKEDGSPLKKPPFAGEGYYFWEDNIEAAEWWGEVRFTKYNKNYYIFKIDVSLRYDDNSFLDLIGNRQHLKFLSKLINRTKTKVDCQNWKLHNFISYFRILQKRNPGIFPFKILRFNDHSINPKLQTPIQLTDYQHKQLINPFYIICVFDLDILDLASFKYIK